MKFYTYRRLGAPTLFILSFFGLYGILLCLIALIESGSLVALVGIGPLGFLVYRAFRKACTHTRNWWSLNFGGDH